MRNGEVGTTEIKLTKKRTRRESHSSDYILFDVSILCLGFLFSVFSPLIVFIVPLWSTTCYRSFPSGDMYPIHISAS